MISIPARFEDAFLRDWEQDHPFRLIGHKYFENLEENLSNGIAPSFFGISGVGKSRAAAAIINTVKMVTNPNPKMSWLPTSESFNKLMDYRDLHQSENYNYLWDRMKNDELVVFDDIGTLRDSPRILEYFWIILDSRYADKKSTIFTGNISVQPPITREQVLDKMSKWISPAFARRLDQFSSGYLVLI